MGNFLSMPCTEKLCVFGANRRFVFGLAGMQGWRDTMEDAHVAELDLDGSGESSNAFFAVYDGHRGTSVVKYIRQHLHERLVAAESYKKQDWTTALKDTFLGSDQDLRPVVGRRDAGSCAIAALLTKDDKIFVANAGDSRSVLSVMGVVKPLSFDHRPARDSEKARISAAGGYVQMVEGVCRVNGDLSLSRGLGDFQYKKKSDLSPEAQIITADPEITCHEITKEDEFLVMACDGIWECLSSQEVIDFVRYQVSKGKELPEICEMIFEHCLAPDSNTKGADNMTLLIIGITHGRTKEEWFQWIRERVRNEYGYKTPSVPPRIYSETKLESFRAKREADEARKKMEPVEKHSDTPGSP